MARQIVIPRQSAGWVGPALLGLIVVIGLWSSYYMVGTDENAVVLRFGRYSRTTGPGLQFKLPFGTDEVIKVPVQRQLREEFGFQSVGRENNRTQYGARVEEESLMVTGDLNAVEVEWSVQYRIDDPQAYLFNMRNPVETLRDASEAVMREVVGDRTVDEVITVGRDEIQTTAHEKLQQITREYKIGITISSIVLQEVVPPDPVAPAFNEVNQAQQQRERMINEARADYNRDIPRIRGEALQQVEAANGYAAQRVNRSRGDAERFEALLAEYLRAPATTRRRIYLETLQEVLPKLGRKVILDENARQVLPLLQLDQAERTTP